jgi:hypothetical protein
VSCCGQRRGPPRAAPRAQEPFTAPVPLPSSGSSLAYFQYTGSTAMTVVGGATRATYRFGHSGAIVGVDPRDRRSVANIPVLRQVPKP